MEIEESGQIIQQKYMYFNLKVVELIWKGTPSLMVFAEDVTH